MKSRSKELLANIDETGELWRMANLCIFETVVAGGKTHKVEVFA